MAFLPERPWNFHGCSSYRKISNSIRHSNRLL